MWFRPCACFPGLPADEVRVRAIVRDDGVHDRPIERPGNPRRDLLVDFPGPHRSRQYGRDGRKRQAEPQCRRAGFGARCGAGDGQRGGGACRPGINLSGRPGPAVVAIGKCRTRTDGPGQEAEAERRACDDTPRRPLQPAPRDRTRPS